MSLAVSLQSRGASATLGRTAQILSRFGPTTAAMARRLDRFESIAAAHGVRPTWPTTACVLERHPALLRRYAERGVELSLHGLVHGDHAAIDAGRQRETIARAIALFERSGLRPSGFRGPYLRYNEDTLGALRARGRPSAGLRGACREIKRGPAGAPPRVGHPLPQQPGVRFPPPPRRSVARGCVPARVGASALWRGRRTHVVRAATPRGRSG